MALPRIPRSDLNLRPFYLLSRVVEAGSLSEAAASLAVTQPALSKEIKLLEDRFGFPLLHRNGRGISLTVEGQMLLTRAEPILSSVIAMENDMDALHGSTRGHVTIAMPTNFGETLAAHLVEHFRQNHPDIRLTIVEGASMDATKWLAEGTVNVAVVYNPPKISTLLSNHLRDDRIYLIGPANGDIGPAGVEVSSKWLSQLPLILPPEPHRLRDNAVEIVGLIGCKPNFAIEVEGTQTILDMVDRELGYTILPESMLASAISRRTLTAWPINPPFTARLELTTSMRQPISAASRCVIQAIQLHLQSRRDDNAFISRENR